MRYLSLVFVWVISCGQPPTSTPTPTPETAPTVRAVALVDKPAASQEIVKPKRSFEHIQLPAAETSQKIEDNCIEGSDDNCKRRALDSFYEKLLKTAAKEPDAITRITQLGDSIINSDYISSAIKQKLQADFGDSGRGYIFTSAPKFYHLVDVSRSSSGWTFKSVVTPQIKDQLYGLGGTAFLGSAGATATFETTKKDLGQRASRASVYYLKQPKGGELELSVDGKSVKKFSTEAAAPEAAKEEIEFEEGPHKVQLKVTKGSARVFGVALEAKGPGVVHDAVGQLSNTVFSMLRANAEHWQAQLALRQTDLVIFSFGANDAGYIKNSKKLAEEYVGKQASLLKRVKATNPNLSCLVFAPMDSADGTHAILADAQRKAAKEVGCAFWDTPAYMGGKGAAATWKKKGLLASDGVHPSVKGAQALGEAFAQSLEVGLADYLKRLSTQTD